MSEVVILLPYAVAIGVVVGLLGAGGSILTVPALLYIVGQDAPTATTTSLIVVGIAAAVGSVPHHRAGRVRLRDGASFAAASTVGAVGGSAAVGAIPEDVLVVGFAALTAAAAVIMLLRRDAGTPVPGRGRAPAWQVAVTGAGVGLITGLFGVGGGFVVVPALVLVLGYALPQAIGTSLVIIVINAGVALITRLAVVDVPWRVALPFAAATVVGVLLAGPLGRRIPVRRLTTAFAVLLFVVAGLTAAQAV